MFEKLSSYLKILPKYSIAYGFVYITHLEPYHHLESWLIVKSYPLVCPVIFLLST